MAKLNIECRPNGDVRYNLEFLGCAFDMTMIANEYGARSDKKALDNQVEEQLGDTLSDILGQEEMEELLEQIASIDVGDLDEVMQALTEYEEQIKTEARP